MDPIRTGKHIEQLRRQREQVVHTLQYIEKERNEAEQNTDWLDQAAYQSRIALLDRLSEWYIKEMDEIDNALDRVKQNKYGHAWRATTPLRHIGWNSPRRPRSAPPARKRGKVYSGFEDLLEAVAKGRSAEWILTYSIV